MHLIETIQIAERAKPVYGAACNSCGWCCLTEVCPVGVELTGSHVGPCKLLVKDTSEEKHYCSLVLNGLVEVAEAIGVGVGCCAETQEEVIKRTLDSNN